MSADNNLDFNVLSERISAQTDAYEKYAQSLTKILELLDEIKSRVKEEGGKSSIASKDLIKTITIISTQLESYISFTRDSDALMVQHLADYNFVGQQLLLEIKKHKDSVTELNETLENLVESTNTEYIELFKTLKSVESSIENLTESNRISSEKIDVIYQNKTGLINTIKSAKYYILAVFTIITIIGALIQLGLFKIIWGS
jgi:chromosome segregation ATPase